MFHDVPEEQDSYVDDHNFVFLWPACSSAVSQDDKRIMKLIEVPLAMDVPLPFGLQKVTNYKCLECECAECQCSVKIRVLSQLHSF